MPTRILLAESDDVLRAGLAEQLAHEGYDVPLRQAKLRLDSLKGRPVFPGHFDDAVYIFRCHT